MSGGGIEISVADGLAIITLAKPDKLNALDAAMIAALAAAAAQIDADASVRVAILTGQGKAFCAGGDIKAWGELSPLAMGQSWVRQGHRAFDALARLKVPLIAALNGHALGGGLELAATADFRIGEERREVRAAGDRHRHGAGLVRHAAHGDPFRRPGGAPPGPDRARS